MIKYLPAIIISFAFFSSFASEENIDLRGAQKVVVSSSLIPRDESVVLRPYAQAVFESWVGSIQCWAGSIQYSVDRYAFTEYRCYYPYSLRETLVSGDEGSIKALADNGIAPAQHLYATRLQLSERTLESILYYKDAAARGYPLSQYNLGCIYLNGSFAQSVDHGHAFELFKKAAEQGHPLAQHNYGMMLQQGLGTGTVDLCQARFWYEKAAAQGEVISIYNLGVMYQKGLGGVVKNERTALSFYKQASHGGYLLAHHALGYMFENGLGGLEKNILMAASCYRQAGSKDKAESLEAACALLRLN